jgi:hypothetical protein
MGSWSSGALVAKSCVKSSAAKTASAMRWSGCSATGMRVSERLAYVGEFLRNSLDWSAAPNCEFRRTSPTVGGDCRAGISRTRARWRRRRRLRRRCRWLAWRRRLLLLSRAARRGSRRRRRRRLRRSRPRAASAAARTPRRRFAPRARAHRVIAQRYAGARY